MRYGLWLRAETYVRFLSSETNHLLGFSYSAAYSYKGSGHFCFSFIMTLPVVIFCFTPTLGTTEVINNAFGQIKPLHWDFFIIKVLISNQKNKLAMKNYKMMALGQVCVFGHCFHNLIMCFSYSEVFQWYTSKQASNGTEAQVTHSRWVDAKHGPHKDTSINDVTLSTLDALGRHVDCEPPWVIPVEQGRNCKTVQEQPYPN